ncbi:MAG: hypothetical protein ACRC14_18630 [Paracoccaceae bacterium]
MNATAIAQTYLDEVAAITMADDWVAYTDLICRPFSIVSHTHTLTFATPDDIRDLYLDFIHLLRTHRITDFIRLVESADQIDDDLISARYVTHLMSGGHRVVDPMKSVTTLRLEGNRWRAATISNAISKSRWPELLPRLRDDTPLKGTDHD